MTSKAKAIAAAIARLNAGDIEGAQQIASDHLEGVSYAPRPRGRPSLTGGRCVTVQTSLSPSQAAWVASRGVPVAAYLRGLVEAEMRKPVDPIKVGDRVQSTGGVVWWYGKVIDDYGAALRVQWDGGQTGNHLRHDLVKIGGDV